MVCIENNKFCFVWRLPYVYSRGYWDSSQIGMYFVIFPWNTFIGKGKGISCHTPPPLPDINSLLFCSLLGKFGPSFLLSYLSKRNFSLHMNLFFLWKASLRYVFIVDISDNITYMMCCNMLFCIWWHLTCHLICHFTCHLTCHLHVILMSSYMS